MVPVGQPDLPAAPVAVAPTAAPVAAAPAASPAAALVAQPVKKDKLGKSSSSAKKARKEKMRTVCQIVILSVCLMLEVLLVDLSFIMVALERGTAR